MTQKATNPSRNSWRRQAIDALKTGEQLYFEHLRLKSTLGTPRNIGKIGPSEVRGLLFQSERQIRLQERAMRHQSINRQDP